MNKKFLFAFFLVFAAVLVFPNTAKQDFLKDVFGTFNNLVDAFAYDYSRITGLYSAGGELAGAATTGSFPSFRAGASFGAIFFTNPIRFLKLMKFYKADWNTMRDKLSDAGMGGVIGWFDSYFLPIPVSNYHFRVGLPYGMNVGGNFNIGPIGAIIRSAAPAINTSYNPEILHWGVGVNFTYAILREHKFIPSLSVTGGFNYSDSTVAFYKLPIGNLELDPSNDSIPSSIGFYSRNNNSSIYFDLTVSKRFAFFQPFVSLRFVQTICHNVTKFNVDLDLRHATASAKNTYAEHVEINNISKIDGFKNVTGAILPVTDFVVSTGFEFVMSIFRMGLQGSFSIASQTGMILLDMRFQVEDWQFDKFKNKTPDNAVSLK